MHESIGGKSKGPRGNGRSVGDGQQRGHGMENGERRVGMIRRQQAKAAIENMTADAWYTTPYKMGPVLFLPVCVVFFFFCPHTSGRFPPSLSIKAG